MEGPTSNSISLHLFLQLYSSPACEISPTTGAIVFPNAAFIQKCTDLEAQQLTRAVLHSEHQPNQLIFTPSHSWSLTHTHYDSVVLLAQPLPSTSTSERVNASAVAPPVAQEALPKPLPDFNIFQHHDLPWYKQKRFQRLVDAPGLMSDLVRAFDFSNTSLGPIHTWPQGLVDMVSFALHSPLPTTAYSKMYTLSQRTSANHASTSRSRSIGSVQ